MLVVCTPDNHPAGNSFSGTVCQVMVLTSMVHASGWKTIVPETNDKENGNKRKLKTSDSACQERPGKQAHVELINNKKRSHEGGDVEQQTYFRRVRGKTTPQEGQLAVLDRESMLITIVPTEKKRGRGRPPGKSENTEQIERDGKSTCLSIYAKMNIIREFERLKEQGVKNVESEMIKSGKYRGLYQGCLSKSKWLGTREKHKWDVLIAKCPELCKKILEVPNCLREALNIQVLWSLIWYILSFLRSFFGILCV